MSKRVLILSHAEARRRAIDAVAIAPDGYTVTIAEPKKSRAQEEKYHAQIGDIARQYLVRGVRLDDEQMKRVLVSAFKEDTKNDPDLGPLWRQVGEMQMVVVLRGEVVLFGDQTRRFPKRLASAFVEWLYAFGAEIDVQWSEPARRAREPA
jgi:hypothetical protein